MADPRAAWDEWGKVGQRDDGAPDPAPAPASSPDEAAAPTGAAADEPTAPAYEVGYGKPPKHTRWAKGTSGNPKGPKKKGGTMRDRVQRLLDREVATTGGQAMTFSDAVLQVAMQGLVGKGGRSAKASIELIDFLERFDTKVEFVPTPADENRLNDLLQQIAARTKRSDNDETK